MALVDFYKRADAAGSSYRVGIVRSPKEVEAQARAQRNAEKTFKHNELVRAAEDFKALSAAAAKRRRAEVLCDDKASLSAESQELLGQCLRVDAVDPAKMDKSPDQWLDVYKYTFGVVDLYLKGIHEQPLNKDEVRAIGAFMATYNLFVDADTIVNVLYILQYEGLLRQTDAAETPLPTLELESEPADDSPESQNPFPDDDVRHNRWFNSDDYFGLCRKQAREGAVRELSQVFRGTVEEIMRDAGGREFNSEQMRGLMTSWENFRPKLPFTREGIRRAFFSKWGKECPDGVMTQEEYNIMLVDSSDPSLSADEFALSVGANPRFRSSGAPVRNVGR